MSERLRLGVIIAAVVVIAALAAVAIYGIQVSQEQYARDMARWIALYG